MQFLPAAARIITGETFHLIFKWVLLVHWDTFEGEDDQTTSCEGLDVLWTTLMKSKKWHIPFSLVGLMIMSMLSVRGKHSSYVAVRLPGIPEMHNVPQRWFSICARRTDYSSESTWKASSSFFSGRWQIWLMHPQQKCYWACIYLKSWSFMFLCSSSHCVRLFSPGFKVTETAFYV